jgi:hypothetical protein
MTNKNMTLWNEAFITDPSAVKKITGKQYQGDSPKPYWLIQRATEIFGPCGEGWGVEVKSESFFRLAENEVMHSAVVVVWYTRDGKRCQIEQMGQTKACYTKKDGGLMTDEDAGKKSVTDGMVKCLSMIGFAGDIFSGLWNDSKYVEYAAAETEKRNAPPPIDYIKAIEESKDIPTLKNHFAAAWKMTPKTEHAPIKAAYDKRNKELSEGQPA